MFRPEHIVQMVRKQPFIPFRISVSDQTQYEINQPDMIMVGERSIIIGVPGRKTGIYARTVIVDLAHITRIEPEPSATTSS